MELSHQYHHPPMPHDQWYHLQLMEMESRKVCGDEIVK